MALLPLYCPAFRARQRPRLPHTCTPRQSLPPSILLSKPPTLMRTVNADDEQPEYKHKSQTSHNSHPTGMGDFVGVPVGAGIKDVVRELLEVDPEEAHEGG